MNHEVYHVKSTILPGPLESAGMVPAAFRDSQTVLSPSWSPHTGAGTGPYSFIYGMAGENQSFFDMDPVKLIN